MKIFKGIYEVLEQYENLPIVGWLYVDDDFDITSKLEIINRNYYLAENDDEEFDFDEVKGTFIEAPTLKMIVKNKRRHHPDASQEELLEAVIYYLEYDSFLD